MNPDRKDRNDRMRAMVGHQIEQINAMFPQFGYAELKVERVVAAFPDGRKFTFTQRADKYCSMTEQKMPR
jgi:hypothetical protein